MRWLPVFKKEMRLYFGSPIAYVVGTFFLLISGWFFSQIFLIYSDISMRSFMQPQFGQNLNITDSVMRPLFTNMDRARKGGASGRRLTGAGLYAVIRALGGKVGLKTRPHGLRHAGITRGLDRTGGDLRAVQRFSRHRDVRTIGLYDDTREDLGGKVARLIVEEVAA